jgi:hypothetical protein
MIVAKPRLVNFTWSRWALSTLGHSDTAFMGALLVEAKPQILSFTPQHLVTTACALADLGCLRQQPRRPWLRARPS